MSDVPGDNPISTTDLDTEFPVPGQDNDSQGFRDNFTVINDNFVASKARLEDLETYAVRNEANTEFLALSTGGTARLVNPTLQNHREVKSDLGENVTNVTVPFSGDTIGTYQTLTLTGNTELTIDGTTVPDSGYYGKIILDITTLTPGSVTLTWDNSLTVKFNEESDSDFWASGSIEPNKNHLIEISTYQGSTTYFAKFIGRFS